MNSGYRFVCRCYDASGGTSNKCLTASEVLDLHNASLFINAVYETCGGSSCCGCPPGVSYFTPSQGTYDANQALGEARAAGQPAGYPIYFAIDYDASTADLGTITGYFNAIYNALADAFPIGVYGSYTVVEYAQANWPGVPSKWQTYAWSGGLLSSAAQLYQSLNGQSVCGVTVDYDTQIAGVGW